MHKHTPLVPLHAPTHTHALYSIQNCVCCSRLTVSITAVTQPPSLTCKGPGWWWSLVSFCSHRCRKVQLEMLRVKPVSLSATHSWVWKWFMEYQTVKLQWIKSYYRINNVIVEVLLDLFHSFIQLSDSIPGRVLNKQFILVYIIVQECSRSSVNYKRNRDSNEFHA